MAMAKGKWDKQRELIEAAIANADRPQALYALDGTIGDTRTFCWATFRQFERRDRPHDGTPKGFGLDFAETHTLLLMASETVEHVGWVESLLARVGAPETLSLPVDLRERIRESRNLLAEHRDERTVYWRVAAKHTPHVLAVHARLGIPTPVGSIDSEVIGYVPPAGASPDEIEEG